MTLPTVNMYIQHAHNTGIWFILCSFILWALVVPVLLE